jgi:ABC-type Fe3+/spermidine/putrescine transport system ATPase subunit
LDTLTLEHIAKKYQEAPLLTDLSLEVHSGELLCLLGRSGSGKSTLLRIITGVEAPDAGRVLWNGEDMAEIPPHLRGFGMMFQDFALFPHLSVEQNVAFGLRLKNLGKDEVTQRVAAALDQVKMGAFAHRRVTDLSGGEQQRVALARSLAPQPRLLLLDEPLGALDRTLRVQMEEDLRAQLKQTGIPGIYVTHDQEEALALADRIALLHEGRIEQVGTPGEVFSRPSSLWAAEFLGLTNFLPGQVVSLDPFTVQTPSGSFHPLPRAAHLGSAQGTLLIKPFLSVTIEERDTLDRLTGQVAECSYQIDHYRIRLQPDQGNALTFSVQSPMKVGETVTLYLKQDALVWYEEWL